MCKICIELQIGKLTTFEALRNLGELRNYLDKDHVEEVEDLIELIEDIGDLVT